MPLLTLHLSEYPAEPARAKLLAELGGILARLTGKPKDYVMVTLSPAAVQMGGKTSPAAFGDVRSIGALSPEVNRNISSEICFLLEKNLGIAKDRIYLNFTAIAPENWGWNGTTFA